MVCGGHRSDRRSFPWFWTCARPRREKTGGEDPWISLLSGVAKQLNARTALHHHPSSKR